MGRRNSVEYYYSDDSDSDDYHGNCCHSNSLRIDQLEHKQNEWYESGEAHGKYGRAWLGRGLARDGGLFRWGYRSGGLRRCHCGRINCRYHKY